MDKKYFPNSFPQVLFILITPFVISLPIFALNNVFKLSLFNITNIFSVIYILLVYLIYFIVNKKKKISINLKINHLVILFGLFVVVYQIIFITPMSFIYKSYWYSEPKTNLLRDIAYLVNVLLISPIIEEIIFRKFILHHFLKEYSVFIAVLFSSIIFSFIHLNVIQAIGSFTLGLFLGYIYSYSRSVGFVIILHFFYNISAVIGAYLKLNYGNFKINSVYDLYGNFSIYIISFSFLVFVYLIYYFYKNKTTLINKLKQLNAPRRLPI